ncbi:helix-turn-helix domain-containing protein [Streptococcus marmotae]|uniref:helix-turn-helix domain-containing protein n=1 Tax=Streptococcus marmotae TaxID=1825069 RepID=UPI000832DCD4|nr:Rgg/GadR/MutR family transcriptional regulator [Streptococcus marmotae]
MIEKKELGEFYRELRIARGVKQKEVARGSLTASQLSKFELGQSMLSVDRLLLAIEGINMTFSEFAYRLNNYHESEHIELAERISTAHIKQDGQELARLLRELRVKEESSRYNRLNSIVVKNALYSLDKQCVLSQKDKDFVTEYLYSIESWTWFELYIFFNTMPLLNDQDLIFLGIELLEKAEAFQMLLHNKLYLKQGLLNLIAEVIERKKYEYILLFKTALEKMLEPYDVFERMILKFLLYVETFLQTDGRNKKEIEQFIQSLEDIGEESLVALLRFKLDYYQMLI